MAVNRIEFNVYISNNLYSQLTLLRQTGMNLSSIARLAIRKCAGVALDEEPEVPSKLKRLLIYLHHDDAVLLQELSAQQGASRAVILRRLLATYLRVNSEAIMSLI